MTRFFRRVLPFCFLRDREELEATAAAASVPIKGFDAELLEEESRRVLFRFRDSFLDLVTPPLPALVDLAAALPEDEGLLPAASRVEAEAEADPSSILTVGLTHLFGRDAAIDPH